MKLLVLGAGNMGLTYATAIAKSGIVGSDKVMILDKDLEKLETLRQEGLFEVYSELGDSVPKADIIMVAVKPQHKDGLFAEMKPLVRAEQMIISVMAGVKIDTMQKALGLTKIVRAMPNLPAQVGMGMTTYFPDTAVSEEEIKLVDQLLASTGQSLLLEKEDDINTSTAVSGSGSAYIFYFIQGMLDGAKHYGYDDETAKELVVQTFAGALEQFKQGDLNPEEWMNRVASKGGTTRAALDSFESNGIRENIKKGMIACYERAIELSKL
ncbi:pyrroline-5-carboxylate reductase [Marinilongibacter aquaticus]|uniref:pyrroline-5-carboxylate reductase n=1 Tax=Marinilongibacter aquaticus TaxID=2975157 RepID=UPI0021BD280C|nr:pyrroline-5-carboxylate reductase [Marinilongibacter aquaticus]UBM59858.1 pyrroline-5-carboxylate reductase [Marinilongibacter aquaticus]